VNQYKTALSVLIFFLPWLVVSIYSELSSGSIQPPLLEPAVPTMCKRFGWKM